MKYLLDADVITAVFDPKSPFFEIAKERLGKLSQDDEIFISILSIYELEFSLSNAKTAEVKNKIINLISDLKRFFEILPLSLGGSKLYGSLKSGFQDRTGINRKTIKKHNIDMMIAATALDNNCVLAAKDTIYQDHLSGVNESLVIEDWTKK